MGVRLLQCYKLVEDRLGPLGRIRLALETKIPSTKAALEEDSEANLELFRLAIARITGSKPPST